jgi:hypothetical protein
VTPFNRASDVLTGCDSGTAVDVCSSGFEQSAARSLVYNQVLRCVLLCAGPSSCNWKKMVEAMVERRSDCVLVSLLHRYCQNQQQHQNQLQYQNQQQLGMITLYTLSSFFIEAPKRLFRNFIEEGGVALLSAAVKALSADIASPYNTISAAAVRQLKQGFKKMRKSLAAPASLTISASWMASAMTRATISLNCGLSTKSYYR